MMPDQSFLRHIHITGNAGSGKTTLARMMGRELGLPVYHLDSIVWQPGWRKTPATERQAAEACLIGQTSWIIEGVSDDVRSAADLVVFLDVPRPVCLYRLFRRNLPFLFRSRPELPDGCPEILIVPRLVRIVLRFPDRLRHRILAEAERSRHYRLIRSSGDAARLRCELNRRLLKAK